MASPEKFWRFADRYREEGRREKMRKRERDRTIEIRPWDGHPGGYSVTRRLKLACNRARMYPGITRAHVRARMRASYIYHTSE